MSENYALLLEKITNIDEKTNRIERGVQQSDRTLRGTNGDGGLVGKVDSITISVKRIDEELVKAKKGIEKNRVTLHGDGQDKIGIVGEQQVIKRLNRWLIGIATGVLTAFIINVVIEFLQKIN